MIKNIVFISGGLNSFLVSDIILKQNRDITLLFTDTKTEDEDLYRFLYDCEKIWNKKIIKIKDGRNVWEVFKDKRYIGNTRIDPCSYYLKRELAKKWIATNCSKNATLYFGIDWTEQHRIKRITQNWAPLNIRMPLIDSCITNPKEEAKLRLKAYNIKIPRLYNMGFLHNNCGGFCIKAGHGHFLNLLKKLPKRYEYHENKEQEIRNYLNKDVAILRDRRGGKTKPFTLKSLRERAEKDASQIDKNDIGGCGCFI